MTTERLLKAAAQREEEEEDQYEAFLSLQCLQMKLEEKTTAEMDATPSPTRVGDQ